jgi:rsbT co-antagonist protein RsbR
MQHWLEVARSFLVQSTLGILRENVTHNRSALPPFRLPQIAQQLITEFGEFLTHKKEEPAVAFGERLGQQGLGLRGLLALSSSLVSGLLEPTNDAAAQVMSHAESARALALLNQFFIHVIQGVSSSELSAVMQQRNEMQSALERGIASREQELRQVILDLSTPVMPLYEQILVLPVIGKLDIERAGLITERLLVEVTQRRARIVIIDITGIPKSSAAVAESLLRTARAAQLLGAVVVLVGISSGTARELSQLNVELTGLPTLATLQDGIEWALKERGLGIQPLPRRSGAAPIRTVISDRSTKNGH